MAEYVCEITQDYPGIPYEHEDFSGTMERREEVVRCRDCAHSWKDGTSCNYFSDFDDGLIIPAIVEPDGFCAWASRREVER